MRLQFNKNIKIKIMKKFILLLISLCSLYCYSQDIKMDEIQPDGRRCVGMKIKAIYIEGRKYAFNLLGYESTNSIKWRILLSAFENIPSDNVVLFKLKNGQTICLDVDTLYNHEYTNNTYVYKGQYVNTVRPGSTWTSYVSEYDIKPEELDDIEAYGITKVRVGNNAKYFESEMTNNVLGKHFTKCRKGITEYLQINGGQKGNGTVYDGF